MNRTHLEPVGRPTSQHGALAWLIEECGGWQVRRTLIALESGEILDDVWLDQHGRVRSYATQPRKGSGAPDRPKPVRVEAVVTTPSRPDDKMVEHRGHDRVLAGQVKTSPPLP